VALNSSSTNPDQGWTSRRITDALGRGGKARIARRANVHNSAVSHVISGRAKSRRLQAMIAQAVHAPVDHIFPVRLQEQGAAA
jgi:lambda repressor-like predicted transcriptional regulator